MLHICIVDPSLVSEFEASESIAITTSGAIVWHTPFATSEDSIPLSALTQPFQKYPQVLKNVRTERGGALLEEPKVLHALRSAEQRLFGAGRMLVRASGTEPLVRVMAEGESFSLCEDCVGEVVAALVAAGGEL